ncbi:hypothetical protein PHYBLDRAFT_56292 [Phycomyces blakesleeanus NRRL 1555(-)]|uniref:UspA domain-containing protein n=2 Tax=Phycomyces blakesleeanus TaxID=4837 RepID=A0A167L987_PHYB8|nr:hypothetical protein PHYBLDRAFT_56292 [Phycomyces blakesleeanus NRRL 1555(-)]OAD69885.1 hypothetical protein PHYBLDRAFT_56292 [Phycomyces blakesleeanus NRRL 1555(-)]|eukprot:XP_018287925.1 hypothetical protein PHYBLDRAFT_56292 [Phycomyces blakesleeanus NRRL 1555(-)]
MSIVDKRRVAIAYDGTDDANRLFKWAIENIIRPESDHIVCLTVKPQREAKYRHKSEDGKDSEYLDAHHDPSLQKLEERITKLGVTIEQHVMFGDPKELIPQYTAREKIDLLIVGSRGLTTLQTVFLGSVSEHCLHECPCPVLVVRNTTIDDQ